MLNGHKAIRQGDRKKAHVLASKKDKIDEVCKLYLEL